jgi:hypothetical protein
VFIRSKNFLVESLESFKNRIVLSANKDNLTSSSSTCIPFIYFSCFIFLAKNSSTTLNKFGLDTLVSFLTLDKMVSIFPYLVQYWILTICMIIYDVYYVEVCSFYSWFVQSFYHEGMLNFFQRLSASVEIMMWFLSLFCLCAILHLLICMC